MDEITYRQTEFQQFARQIQGLPVPPLIGNRHYYCSDYMVHRRANYVTSVHMYSTRIIPARCVNEQGKLSEHYGDGLNYLYYTGKQRSCSNATLIDSQASVLHSANHSSILTECSLQCLKRNRQG